MLFISNQKLIPVKSYNDLKKLIQTGSFFLERTNKMFFDVKIKVWDSDSAFKKTYFFVYFIKFCRNIKMVLAFNLSSLVILCIHWAFGFTEAKKYCSGIMKEFDDFVHILKVLLFHKILSMM